MKIKELREFLIQLPKEFDEFNCVTAQLSAESNEEKNDLIFRLDTPLHAMAVDEKTKELLLFTDEPNLTEYN